MNTHNGSARQKVWAEIELLTEQQLEELYAVVHYYRLGAAASASQNPETAKEDRARQLVEVLAQMQSLTLADGAPRLSREALHERR